MTTVEIAVGSKKGCETRTLYCPKCGKVESREIEDPAKAAAGWLAGELQPPK
jgi:hypothetical protein